MRIKIYIFLITLSFISSVYGACHNYRQITMQANTVSRDLFDLRFEVRTSFPNSWSLYDFIQRTEMDASFLHRTTRSGAMPCWQSKSTFSRLESSAQVLRNYFRGFSRRRDVSRVAYEWRRFIDSYRRLEIIMANAREE